MRFRDLVLLIAALCLLSAVVGLFVLLYLDVWHATPATETPKQRIAESDMPPQTQVSDPIGAATATLPSLVTPTSTLPPTPTLTPSSTPSPTPTWTPTPSATPTPLPGDRLASALKAKQNGDYELAALELWRLVGNVEEGMVLESLYELAVCEFLSRNYETAREILEQFLIQ
jgi:hypothetical protein